MVFGATWVYFVAQRGSKCEVRVPDRSFLRNVLTRFVSCSGLGFSFGSKVLVSRERGFFPLDVVHFLLERVFCFLWT